MGTVQEVFLRHVCPALGGCIACIAFLSPLRAVLAVNRTKHLGELNALPFAAMVANSLAWILYGFLLRDFYVYAANIPGVLAGLLYVLICYKFSKEQAQDALRNILLATAVLYFAVALADMAANLDFENKKKLWGSTAVGVLAIYYSAPLSSVAKVISERDSSSLHWPLCAMNTINGLLWFAYGLAIKDWFICVPNGVGAAFNVVCLVFCFIFPARGRSRLAGQVSPPASNWAALRLQSIRLPAGSSGSASAAAAGNGGGGFFDVTQFRWRQSPDGFFRRLSSRLSGRLNSSGLPGEGGGWEPPSQQLPAGAVAAAGEGSKHVIAAVDEAGDLGFSGNKDVARDGQLEASSGGSGSKKIPAVLAAAAAAPAAAGDVEQGT